jgi:hypothetical protein
VRNSRPIFFWTTLIHKLHHRKRSFKLLYLLLLFSKSCQSKQQIEMRKFAQNWSPRGQFFNTCEGANFAHRHQLERRQHCCVGANSPRRRKLSFKKLPSAFHNAIGLALEAAILGLAPVTKLDSRKFKLGGMKLHS